MKRARRRREEYQQAFTEDDLLLVRFEHIGSTVVNFSVQYLGRINGDWHPIVRYDTAHGYAHLDISLPDGAQETRDLKASTYGDALVTAIEDIQARWEFYRERYGEQK